MLNTIELNRILNLLNLNISYQNGKYYISNYSANTTDTLEKLDGYYSYIFTKDEEKYTIKINPTSLIIFHNHQIISFNNDGFTYQEKENEINREHVYIFGNTVSFYQNDGINSFSIKIGTSHGKFDFLKIAEQTKIDETYKKDTVIQRTEQGTSKSVIQRVYSNRGVLTNFTRNDTVSSTPIDEAIPNEIHIYDLPSELMDKINTVIPDIISYLIETNQCLERIRLDDNSPKKR